MESISPHRHLPRHRRTCEKRITLILEGILNKGKIAKIDDRNRTIRAIYQNLRQTYTRDEAIRQLRKQYKFGYLTPRTLIDIISKS